jgi:hypothetical protein
MEMAVSTAAIEPMTLIFIVASSDRMMRIGIPRIYWNFKRPNREKKEQGG